MGSKTDNFGDAVSVDFHCVGVVNRKKFKKHVGRVQYTNLRCDNCDQWWIMLCLDQKKVRCPWCGAKCKTKHI